MKLMDLGLLQPAKKKEHSGDTERDISNSAFSRLSKYFHSRMKVSMKP